jgi:CRP-like cAMP-binding protein
MKDAATVGTVRPLRAGPRGTGARLLARVPIFEGLSGRDLRKVASLAEEVWLNAGKVVVAEGEPGDSFYVILDGRAKATRSRRTVGELGPGDHFGELALIDAGPRAATVVALTTLDVVRIRRGAFRRLLLAEPRVGLKIMEQLVAWIREYASQVPA